MISGIMRKRRIPTPCLGCGRARRICWADPCSHLKVIKSRSVAELTRWVEAGGGTVTVKT